MTADVDINGGVCEDEISPPSAATFRKEEVMKRGSRSHERSARGSDVHPICLWSEDVGTRHQKTELFMSSGAEEGYVDFDPYKFN